MIEEQKTRVKSYVTILNSDIPNGDLLDLVVDIVSDRVLLYLNELILDPLLERIVAQVVVNNYMSVTNPQEQSIASVEDNGQAVRYHQTTVQHFGSKSDSEIFGGFEKLLASHRRINVITS